MHDGMNARPCLLSSSYLQDISQLSVLIFIKFVQFVSFIVFTGLHKSLTILFPLFLFYTSCGESHEVFVLDYTIDDFKNKQKHILIFFQFYSIFKERMHPFLLIKESNYYHPLLYYYYICTNTNGLKTITSQLDW